jgi:hypothetical protein
LQQHRWQRSGEIGDADGVAGEINSNATPEFCSSSRNAWRRAVTDRAITARSCRRCHRAIIDDDRPAGERNAFGAPGEHDHVVVHRPRWRRIREHVPEGLMLVRRQVRRLEDRPSVASDCSPNRSLPG